MSKRKNLLLAKKAQTQVGDHGQAGHGHQKCPYFRLNRVAPSVEEYLKEAAGRSLSGWFIGPEATTPSDIAAQTAFNFFKSLLDRQARGAPVAALKGVPILLATGENECEEDNEFIR